MEYSSQWSTARLGRTTSYSGTGRATISGSAGSNAAGNGSCDYGSSSGSGFTGPGQYVTDRVLELGGFGDKTCGGSNWYSSSSGSGSGGNTGNGIGIGPCDHRSRNNATGNHLAGYFIAGRHSWRYCQLNEKYGAEDSGYGVTTSGDDASGRGSSSTKRLSSSSERLSISTSRISGTSRLRAKCERIPTGMGIRADAGACRDWFTLAN